MDLEERLKAALADRYQLEREIGSGGMATVYLAQDLKHDRQVAVKVLKPELAAVMGTERFLAEIRTTANLRHPHILPLYDSGEADGFLFYVMPYVQGESLRARLEREKQLPVEDALRISREVADALSYAHSGGVIHRDIKPANILLEAGHAVVADFGIARAVDEAGGAQLTGTGVALGTPAYMSPEQAAGERGLDGRSDLYSLACVLYEMLAGEPPYTGPTVESLVHQHLTAEPPNITGRRPAVSGHVAAALERALSKTPADRFNPVALFGEALEPSQMARVGPAPGVPEGQAPASPWAKRWAPVAIAAAVVIVGAVALAWPFGRTSGPRFPRTAIAVLPFENLSGEGPNAYFAGGLHEELLTQLAKVAALKVIGRTSVLTYEGSTKRLREIGAELEVGSLLEGSVQVVGNRLRVTVQLIDPVTEAHVWADTYDQTLDDAFAVQSEIARKVVAAVGGTLTGAEARVMATAPTASGDAYQLYLQGRQYFTRGLGDPTIVLAAELYDSAAALDPVFALAHAASAKAHARAEFQRIDPGGAHGAKARASAVRALELAPDLAEAHEAMGWYSYWVEGDWVAAAGQFTVAANRARGNAEVQLGLGLAYRRLGRWEDGLEAIRRASELDPLSAEAAVEVGISHLFARRSQDAVEAFRRATTLAPDQDRGYGYLALALIAQGAGTDSAVQVLRSGAEILGQARFVRGLLGPNAAPGISWLLMEAFPGAMGSLAREELGSYLLEYLVTLAEWRATRGDVERQHAYADSALELNPGYLQALATAGRREATLQAADDELGEIADDRRGGPQTLYDVARAQVLIGETDLAIRHLEQWLASPREGSINLLRLDPLWDPLRDHPRFQSLLEEYADAVEH